LTTGYPCSYYRLAGGMNALTGLSVWASNPSAACNPSTGQFSQFRSHSYECLES
jgi:hypothetical protein